MKKKLFSKLKIIGLSLTLLPIGGIVLSCANGAEDIPSYKQNPKYILNGDEVATQPNSGKYDYYYISSGTYAGNYAISLKESYVEAAYDKNHEVNLNDIPTKYNDGTHGEHDVVGIWRSGFANSNISGITLRNTNIKVIDYEAFLGCVHLKSIIIPYTVSEIGDAAFYGCRDIVSAVFDNYATSASGGATYSCTCIEPGETVNVTSVALDELTLEIEVGESKELTATILPENATNTEVTWSSSSTAVATVDDGLITGVATGSATITVTTQDGGKTATCTVTVISASGGGEGGGEGGEEGGESEEIPDDESHLTKIPDFCFFNCSSMTELQLPAHIQEVGYEAFNGCIALKSTLAFQDIRTIRERAFQGCKELTTVYIPSTFFTNNGVIEAHAFNYCFDELEIYFSGDSTTLSTWETNHSTWGLYSDTDNTKIYHYHETDANTKYSGEWTFTVTQVSHKKYDVTITGFKPQDPTKTVEYLSIPNNLPLGNKDYKVRDIEKNFISDSMKRSLKRIYLPTTLRYIRNFMFDDFYDNLVVVDSNTGNSIIDAEHDSDKTDCQKDATTAASDAAQPKPKPDNIIKRIILSDLNDLEVIGDCAFMNMDKGEQITKLYLPAGLKAVGNSAFGSSKKVELTYGTETFTVQMKHMKSVTDFKWNYDESKAQLVGIGNDAFYKLGANDSGTDIKKEDGTVPHPSIDQYGNRAHETMTLILPKTFRHTGFTDPEADEFKLHHNADTISGKNIKYKGEHAFAGCPLIDSVIIKGSPVDSNGVPQTDSSVKDLVIGLQTFAYLECCRSIIIEERKNCTIAFHTQIGKWTEPCIGWNSGRAGNDYDGDPFLQTLVLPNKYTKLVFQEFAFQANSRLAIYFSGGKWVSADNNNNLFSNTSIQNLLKQNNNDNYARICTTSPANNYTLANIDYWNLIGNEDKLKARVNGNDQDYVGYRINPATNKFGIDQYAPTYYNVHYKETFTVNGKNINVEVGDNTCTSDLVLVSETTTGTDVDGNDDVYFQKYAFVCDAGSGNNKKATFSKYLYDRWNKDFTGVAIVPETVTNKSGATCEVNKIGSSAFCAAYCDNQYFKIDTDNDGDYDEESIFKDLSEVKIPNTVTEIGDYAFMRAYGVTKLSSYSGNTTYDDTMPTGLTKIGRHAFAFCNIQKILGIPNDCELYETSSAVTDDKYKQTLTSAFTNNFSLRQITFVDTDQGNNGYENSKTRSKYYEVTTYEHSSGVNYTSALYSKSNANSNENRLLLVLYRTGTDELKASKASDGTSAGDVKIETQDGVSVNEFNGQYRTNRYLYGAFKMAYWVDTLIVGNPTNSDSFSQPIISGLYDRANETDFPLYLHNNTVDFSGKDKNNNPIINTDLTTISFDTSAGLKVQPEAFAGCNNLVKMKLPRDPDKEIPSGILTGTSINRFEVPTPLVPGDDGYDPDEVKYKYVEKANGVLDLTYTGYKGIKDASNGGKGTFEDVTTIKKIIAPNVANFTVGSQAFKGCTNLEVIDFSNVTNKVTIKTSAFENCKKLKEIDFTGNNGDCKVEIGSSAFKNCVINDTGGNPGIKWPTTNKVSLGDNAFEGCAFNSHSISLALRTDSIGSSCFKDCTTLTEVTCSGDLNDLTALGDSSFEGCTGLTNFNFAKFKELTKIGNKAFYTESGTPVIYNSGVIDLPNKVNQIGSEAFKNSGITRVIVNSNALELDFDAFKNCTSLTSFYFTNPSCNFTSRNGACGFFDGCGTNFTQLFMPTNGLDLNSNLSSSIVSGDTAAKIYSYHKYGDGASTGNTRWREYEAGYLVGIVYFMENSAEYNYSSITIDPNTHKSNMAFWTYDGSDNVVYLGYITSVSNGVITFDTGHTVDANGFVS